VKGIHTFCGSSANLPSMSDLIISVADNNKIVTVFGLQQYEVHLLSSTDTCKVNSRPLERDDACHLHPH